MLLTHEEIEAVWVEHGLDECDCHGFARAIEAKIMERLGEPVTHQFQGRDGEWYGFIDQRHYENTVADGSWPIRALDKLPEVK